MLKTKHFILSTTRTSLRSSLKSPVSFNRSVSSSSFLLEKVTVNVPTLGESISEGAISSFEKKAGDVVQVDDIIAVIETDKITVDIKSPYTGTLVEVLGTESEEISVGSPLYVIDTNDDLADNASKKQSQDTQESSSLAANKDTNTESQNKQRKRVPLIKFLGKRSLLHQSEKSPLPEKPSISESSYPSSSPVGSIFDGYDKATLGRPLLSDAEIEAVESGGASMFA